MHPLKSGTTLQHGRYVIIEMTGQESLSMKYRLLQTTTDREVCCDEFFMRDFCMRDAEGIAVSVDADYACQVDMFKKKFRDDAKAEIKSATDKARNIIDIFDENNTVYVIYVNTSARDGESASADATPKAGDVTGTGNAVNMTGDPVHDDSGAKDSHDIPSHGPKEQRDSRNRVSCDVKPRHGHHGGLLLDADSKRPSAEGVACHRLRNRLVLSLLCAAFALGGFGVACMVIDGFEPDDMPKEVPLLDKEAGKELAVEAANIDAGGDVVQEHDMEGNSISDNGSRQTLDNYMRLFNECLAKAKANRHKPSNINNVLDARFYYYDKANKLNKELTGKELPRNAEIDKLMEDEYNYWVSEAHKIGKNRAKFQQKLRYLKNAERLSIRHKSQLNAQIDWLEKELKKSDKKQRRR